MRHNLQDFDGNHWVSPLLQRPSLISQKQDEVEYLTEWRSDVLLRLVEEEIILPQKITKIEAVNLLGARMGDKSPSEHVDLNEKDWKFLVRAFKQAYSKQTKFRRAFLPHLTLIQRDMLPYLKSVPHPKGKIIYYQITSGCIHYFKTKLNAP